MIRLTLHKLDLALYRLLVRADFICVDCKRPTVWSKHIGLLLITRCSECHATDNMPGVNDDPRWVELEKQRKARP